MRKSLIITISVVCLLIVTVSLFVFKASGSNNSVTLNGCDPFNVKVEKGESDNEILISWNTKQKCSAYVTYGSDMKDLSLIAIDSENEVKDNKHVVSIGGVLSTKTYYFSIVSDGTTYGKNGLPISFSLDSL